METLSHGIAWTNDLLTRAWPLWFVIGAVVGGVPLAHDERRRHRTRPKPDEVRAYADRLVARHGREAFRINGEAMVAARGAKEFDRYRFLKEVSGELVDQLFGRHTGPGRATFDRDASAPVCFPGAYPPRSEHRGGKRLIS